MKKKLSDAVMKKRFQEVLKHIYCLHCKKNVPVSDYDAWIDQGGIVLKGKCDLCGGEVSRFIEVE
jgi:NAD-dependent SIR2 family protein deacetylase